MSSSSSTLSCSGEEQGWHRGPVIYGREEGGVWRVRASYWKAEVIKDVWSALSWSYLSVAVSSSVALLGCLQCCYAFKYIFELHQWELMKWNEKDYCKGTDVAALYEYLKMISVCIFVYATNTHLPIACSLHLHTELRMPIWSTWAQCWLVLCCYFFLFFHSHKPVGNLSHLQCKGHMQIRFISAHFFPIVFVKLWSEIWSNLPGLFPALPYVCGMYVVI